MVKIKYIIGILTLTLFAGFTLISCKNTAGQKLNTQLNTNISDGINQSHEQGAADKKQINDKVALSDLDLFKHDYPRFFQFRSCETATTKYGYDDWNKIYSPFDGIMGKVLEEEVPGRSKNIEYFTRFKKEHPGKMVMLHYNGRARDPRDGMNFFAGHWLYYKGCKALSNIPAIVEDTEITVEDTSLFEVNTGRYKNSNEDLVLCVLKEDNKPDWNRVEQVKLVSINSDRKTITVKRGQYGTKPLEFEANRIWVAAHVSEGPWGEKSNLIWSYNYSPDCPKDQNGKQAADVILEELSGYFKPGGKLEVFDGLEFDVLYNEIHRAADLNRGVDTNGDLVPDNGYINGQNRYGIGVYDFLKRLREKIGDDKFILADGHAKQHQRAFDQLNGMESEGFQDLQLNGNDWSGGVNRHLFWNRNARLPIFHYINHKYIAEKPEKDKYNIDRICFAAAQFTDAVLTAATLPPAQSSTWTNNGIPVWDEWVKGKEKQQGWLGKAIGPAIRLAKTTPDLLSGAGRETDERLFKMIAPSFSGNGDAQTITFKPIADTYVNSLKPTDKYGSGNRLNVHDPSIEETYIKFDVTGIRTPIKRVVLQLYCTYVPSGETGDTTIRLYKVDNNDWDEKSITYDTKLKKDLESVMEFGITKAALSNWVEFDITKHIKENGTYTFALDSAKKSRYGFASKEASSNNPQLVITVDIDQEELEKKKNEIEMQIKEKKLIGINGVDIIKQGNELMIQGTEPESKMNSMVLRLKGVELSGPDLSVFCTLRAEPMKNYPPAISRCIQAKVIGSNGKEHRSIMTWANQKSFEAGFYFEDIDASSVDIEFEIEGTEKVWIEDLTAHAYPDAIYREFENGLILANPSLHPFEFDLAALLPEKSYRRIEGTEYQDPITNNGKPVGNKVIIPAYDALFLVKE